MPGVGPPPEQYPASDMLEQLLQEVLVRRMGPLKEVSVVGVDHHVTDNCLSDVSRLRARVVTGAGEKELSLLLKNSNLEEVDGILPATEIKVYQDVLPRMERLITKMCLPHEILWAHCVGHFNTTLVLEDLQVRERHRIKKVVPVNVLFRQLLDFKYNPDLQELGFQTVDRSRGLDYPHAALAVRGLAQFHALSVVLEDMGDLRTSDFDKFYFDGANEHVNGFITSSFQYLHKVALRDWSPEWKDIIDNIGRIPEMAVEKMREITKLQGGFCVLNHGDTWVNNMMFRHNDGIPVSVRFVDYKLSHYNSYAFDLHYLLNTSLSTEVLHHIERLYEEYHFHLTAELARLGRSEAPSLLDLCTELERTEFFGLFSAVAVAPVIMAEQEIAPIKDDSGCTLNELEQRKEERYRTEEYKRWIQVILRRAQHGGLFKRLLM